MQIDRKASLRAGGASHPSRTFGESSEVMIWASRLDDSRNFLRHQFHEFARNISRESRSPPRLFPSYASWSGHGRIAWLLPRTSPLAPTYAPSHASYAISCTPIPPLSSSKFRNTPSTNQLHVFVFHVGRSVWLKKDYCLNASSSSKFFRQGGNAWNLFDFDSQSEAFLLRYHKILFYPSVPNGLEEVRTGPELSFYLIRPGITP